MFNLAILIALVQYHHNLVSGELLAAAGGDDSAFGNGTDDVIIKGYTHFGKGGGQTYLTDQSELLLEIEEYPRSEPNS